MPPSTASQNSSDGAADTVLELVSLTPEELTVIHRATEALVADCLAGRGFDYEPLPPPDYGAVGADRQRTRTLDDARVSGFLPVRVFAASGFSPEEQELNQRLTSEPEFAAAYFGPEAEPAGGCYTQAQSAVLGTEEPTFQTLQVEVERSRAELGTAIRISEKYLVLQQGWSACMQAAGYNNYASLDALYETSWPAPRPTQVEIDTAVADFTCEASGGLPAFLQDEMRIREDEWVDQHPGILEQIRDRRAEAVARATAAVPTP